jgi:Transposase DNA-binding/Transposase DDE domain
MKLPRRSVERVVAPFASAELGDPRRTRRLMRVAERLAQAPAKSLPAAVGNDAELQGAYRLMNNAGVTFEAVLAPQVEATALRAQEIRKVLVLHDTTDCSFPNLDPAELGYLNTGKAGFRLHLSLAVDGDGSRRPLGVIHAETMFRARRSRRRGKVSGPESAKRTDRESSRWWRGVTASADALKATQRVVHIADREGDSYELMAQMMAAQQRFIIRVRVDRRGRSVEAKDDEWSTVRQVASSSEGVLERDVPLSRRSKKSAPAMNRAHPPRKARLARLRFSATRIVIPRPQYLHEPVPKTLVVNLVHVVEVDPPAGEPGVEWLLYTTEPISTPEEVAEVVDDYRTRWLIEEFNAALKTGCVYEEREFESRHALLTMLALSLPIACEVLWLRSQARSLPEAPATSVLTTVQLKILRKLGSYRLSAKPTAEEALLAVAAMGGHLKRNGAPGWKVLQRGMSLLLAYQLGWEAATA